MTLEELVEWVQSIGPKDTEVIKVTAEIRIRKPGGVTTVLLDYPDPITSWVPPRTPNPTLEDPPGPPFGRRFA
jgi:hypothetical protein